MFNSSRHSIFELFSVGVVKVSSRNQHTFKPEFNFFACFTENHAAIWTCAFVLMHRCTVHLHVRWGMGMLWTEKNTPIPQKLWPCSLSPLSFKYFSTTPITQTLHALATPPRSLREEKEKSDLARMGERKEGGGGQPGENLPCLAFRSSSRQGDRSAVTPALEETAPSSGGGDGPPSFALR